MMLSKNTKFGEVVTIMDPNTFEPKAAIILHDNVAKWLYDHDMVYTLVMYTMEYAADMQTPATIKDENNIEWINFKRKEDAVEFKLVWT